LKAMLKDELFENALAQLNTALRHWERNFGLRNLLGQSPKARVPYEVSTVHVRTFLGLPDPVWTMLANPPAQAPATLFVDLRTLVEIPGEDVVLDDRYWKVARELLRACYGLSRSIKTTMSISVPKAKHSRPLARSTTARRSCTGHQSATVIHVR